LILNTNLKGPFVCAQVFLPLLAEAGVVSAVAMAMIAAPLVSAAKRMPSGPKASGPID